MQQDSYIRPSFGVDNFHCPLCGVHAKQYWKEGDVTTHRCDYGDYDTELYSIIFYSSKCNSCGKCSIWRQEKDLVRDVSTAEMVYPKILTASEAHKDMPESVKELYEEARNISSDSSRAAAALLRCALDRLAEHLGEAEGALNTKIGNLVERGLPVVV